MILVTFTRQQLPDGKPQLDYIQLESVDSIPDWLAGLGSKLTFSLNKKKRTLTQDGWEKNDVFTANLIHVMDDTQKTLVNVKKIVSGDGILFEDVKHCSEKIVDLMASKCVITAN